MELLHIINITTNHSIHVITAKEDDIFIKIITELDVVEEEVVIIKITEIILIRLITTEEEVEIIILHAIELECDKEEEAEDIITTTIITSIKHQLIAINHHETETIISHHKLRVIISKIETIITTITTETSNK